MADAMSARGPSGGCVRAYRVRPRGVVSHIRNFGTASQGQCTLSFSFILAGSVGLLIYRLGKLLKAAMMYVYDYYDFTLSKVPSRFRLRLKDHL